VPAFTFSLLYATPLCADSKIGPAKSYAAAADALERFIQKEIAEKELPALSIALVDNQTIVWARGFGFAKPKDKIAASADTVYRVGSVSKLFTDVGIMQLVEHGALDLDAPVTRYFPDFKPANPFGKPITLRKLMAHRSGLVRESPIGHYFDPTHPSLADTVLSLNKTELVYAPETRIKYSNAGVATVGYVLEHTQGEPFAKYLKRNLLDNLGMSKSSFEATPELTKDLADAFMWTCDGRVFDAPTFPLGTSPAGNMYSTVTDLGKFMSVLFAGGKSAAGQVLTAASIKQMWTPQFAKAGEKTGFGLGFHLGELEGRRTVGHDGAVYGFATTLNALPDEKLGVVVVATKDCVNPVTDRIANVALAHMLAVRQGRPLPAIATTASLGHDSARRLAGQYVQNGAGLDLFEYNGRVFAWPLRGGTRMELRNQGNTLISDDRLAYGDKIVAEKDQLKFEDMVLPRSATSKPHPSPGKWSGLIGEYGWDYDILYILENHGKLHALIEWFYLYPLEEVSENVFKFPDHGLYDGEKLVFTRDAAGRATRVEAANVVFKRRPIDGENGLTFRIKAQRPIEELRREALAAQPPAEPGTFRKPDLIEPTTLDPSIKLDIRYASTNNFLSTPFYSSAKAFMQRPAAEALVRVHRKLKNQGFGLLIHDCYRPWYVTKMFWEATPEKERIFVADPAKGSRHNRGCAVDLTLYDLKSGEPIKMVGGYDEFSDRSYPIYPGGTSRERWHRDLLRHAMEDDGFSVYEAEWWHFDFKDWRVYPILNLTFEQLK